MLSTRALISLTLLLHLVVFDVEPPHPLHPFARLRPTLSAASSAALPQRAAASPAPAPAPVVQPCPPSFPAEILSAALGSLTASDGAALRVFPASQLLGGGGNDDTLAGAAPRVGASEELCALLLVQQPASIAAWLQREMDLPYLMPNENNDVYPAMARAGSRSYSHVGAPDDVLLRLTAGAGAEVHINASLRLLTPPEGAEGGGGGGGGARGWWWHAAAALPVIEGFTAPHTPPMFTAYAGTVDRDALWQLHSATAGAAGAAAAASAAVAAAPLPAALVAHVEHPLWSWNSGPRRTLFPCSGEGNPGCGAWDDVGDFKSALGPYYAPLNPMVAPFTFEGGALRGGGGPAVPRARAMGPVQCATATQGFWTTEASAGALPLRKGGPYWRPAACDAAAFTNAHVSACLRSRFPKAMLVGDSHMRRHFKDLIGRSASLMDYYAARIEGGILVGAAGPPTATEGGKLVEAKEVAVGESISGAAHSMWCWGREEDFDCTCSDAAHGPTDPDPNPLTFLYKEVSARWDDRAGGGPPGAPALAEATLFWWTGFLFPHWRDDLLAAGRAAPDLVVFTLGHWDTAYNALSRFEAELPHLSATLAEAFPPPALIVFRTPSFFAGDDTWAEKNQGRRWYSHGKIARIKALLMDELLGGALRGRLLVWDVFAVGAGRPVNETKAQSGSCRAGHERSEFAQLQNALLFNMLCPAEF